MTTRISVTVLTLAFAVCFAAGARADRFSFSTGSPDGQLGALSRPPGQGLETETADDFVLTQATVVSGGYNSRVDPYGNSRLQRCERRGGNLPHLSRGL
jgi:hypothetical protein